MNYLKEGWTIQPGSFIQPGNLYPQGSYLPYLDTTTDSVKFFYN